MPVVRTISWPWALATALLLVAGFHGGASALPYTLGAPLAITGSEPGNPGVIGFLEPVALGSALSDPRENEIGDTSFVANDVFVVRLTLSGGSLAVDTVQIAVGSTPFFGNPVGAGTFADAGDQAPSSVSLPSFGFRADFDFAGGSLDAGESSQRLFVTYAPAGSALDIGRIASFTLSAGTDFTVQASIVPEPGVVPLFSLGLTGLALYRRRRSFVR